MGTAKALLDAPEHVIERIEIEAIRRRMRGAA
jgi:hypothetical protein